MPETRICNVVNGIYQEPLNGADEKCIHPDTPLKQELISLVNQFATLKAQYGNYISFFCDQSSVVVKYFGYDSDGKIKGFVADYTLTTELSNNGKSTTKEENLTSFFVFTDKNNSQLVWVADVVK
jgi:hypothetical protein